MIARFTLLVLVAVLGTSFALKGRLTHYCSYPPCCKSRLNPPYTNAELKSCTGNSECKIYSGCKYQGQFSFCDKKSRDYVVKTNIVSFFSTHGDTKKYQNKMLRITQGSKTIDALVCDTCDDDDCEGCCTENAGSSGYLIDMESNTYERFGVSGGPVTWSCLNC